MLVGHRTRPITQVIWSFSWEVIILCSHRKQNRGSEVQSDGVASKRQRGGS